MTDGQVGQRASSERVSVADCQRRLATLWGVFSVLIFAIIFAQSAGNKYVRTVDNEEFDLSGQVFEWFLPLVIPTLSLMIGTVVAQAQRPPTDATVSRFVYRFSFWLSAIYLVVVMLHLFLFPENFFERLRASTFYVASLQGLVGLSLGAFFVSRDNEPKPAN